MSSNIFERIRDRAIRYQDEHRRRNLPKPSFHAKMTERKRLAETVRRLRGPAHAGKPIYEMEDKLGQKEVAKRAGVPTARILQGPHDGLRDFDLDALPPRFVVKPIVGSGSNGVFLLEKRDGGLFDIITKERYPDGLEGLDAAGLSAFAGCPLIAEEFIGFDSRPSFDWKLHVFFGEVGLVRQGDLSKPGKPYKLWSPEGEELGPIDNLRFRYDSSLPPAEDLGAIVATARKVSLSIPTPFVRVDLYEADDGVHLGEVTFRPSSLWKRKHLRKFTPEWDRKFGEMWENAQARLIEEIGESYLP